MGLTTQGHMRGYVTAAVVGMVVMCCRFCCPLVHMPVCLQGFFYNRYPEPKKGELGTETDINLNQQLCYHVVGQPQQWDAVILACPDHPAWQQGAEVTDDGRSVHTLRQAVMMSRYVSCL